MDQNLPSLGSWLFWFIVFAIPFLRMFERVGISRWCIVFLVVPMIGPLISWILVAAKDWPLDDKRSGNGSI